MIILISFLLPTFALSSTSAYQWLSVYPQSTEAKEILRRYYGVGEDFSTNLHDWSRKQLAKSAASAIKMHQQNNCTESTLFKILDHQKHFPDASEREAKFSDSIILIETAYCAPEASIQNAYTIYMSREFRENVMPQVISFTEKNSIYCTKGEGVLGILKPTEYCYKATEKRDRDTIVLRNSFHSVRHGDDYQPFYFREEVITFVQMTSGVGLYRATLTRSADLSSASKYLLRSTVDSSQGNIREQYYEWLSTRKE